MIFLWPVLHYSFLNFNWTTITLTSAWLYVSVPLWYLTVFCIFSFLYWVPQSSLWLTVRPGEIRLPDLTWLACTFIATYMHGVHDSDATRKGPTQWMAKLKSFKAFWFCIKNAYRNKNQVITSATINFIPNWSCFYIWNGIMYWLHTHTVVEIAIYSCNNVPMCRVCIMWHHNCLKDTRLQDQYISHTYVYTMLLPYVL